MFFILMPIIFEFYMSLILHYSQCNYQIKEIEGNFKVEVIIFFIFLVINYLIEFIHLKKIRNMLGVWMFSKEFNNIETYNIFHDFVMTSIICFGLIGLISLIVKEICTDYEIIFWHVAALIVVIICIYIMPIASLHDSQEDALFDSINYTVDENTIYLTSIGDGREISGDIHGGRFYVEGKIETNYELYYAFINENGITIIKSIPYNENNVKIHEIGDVGEPRIVFHKYYKSYSCPIGHEKYDEYYIYDIYIPSISNSLKLDME